MNRSVLWPLAITALLRAASGLAAEEATDEGASRPAAAALAAAVEQQQRLFRELQQSLDPRDWMVASGLKPRAIADEIDYLEREDALRNAASAAPDDALIQWVYALHQDRRTGMCGRDSVLVAERVQRVLRLETDNGAAWMLQLGVALHEKDDLAVEQALAHIAAAPRFDTHWHENARLWTETFKRSPLAAPPTPVKLGTDPDPTYVALVAAAAPSTWQTLPGFAPIRLACPADLDPIHDTRRLATCIDIGRRWLKAPLGLVRSFGAALLDHAGELDASDSADQARYENVSDAFARYASEHGLGREQQRAFAMDTLSGMDEKEVYDNAVKRAGLAIDALGASLAR